MAKQKGITDSLIPSMEKNILKQFRSNTALESTKKVSHYVFGEPVEQIYGLQIVSYPDDSGYYLLYLDKNGQEITDTYHDTIESAIDQATFEFRLKRSEWS